MSNPSAGSTAGSFVPALKWVSGKTDINGTTYTIKTLTLPPGTDMQTSSNLLREGVVQEYQESMRDSRSSSSFGPTVDALARTSIQLRTVESQVPGGGRNVGLLSRLDENNMRLYWAITENAEMTKTALEQAAQRRPPNVVIPLPLP